MITLTFLLVLAAFVATILSLMGKAPLGVAVLCLVLVHLLQLIPVR